MKPLLLLPLLLLTSCLAYDDGLLPCLWRGVGAIDAPPEGEPLPGQCLRVTAPDTGRVSAEPLTSCDVYDVGLRVVYVPAGQPVYRYSYPDTTPEPYAATWADCPAGAGGAP